MTVTIITRAALGEELKLTASDQPPLSALAQIMRAALHRWGLSPRRDLLRWSRDHLSACGLDDNDSACRRALDALVALGECCEVTLSGTKHIAPNAPRWIRSGNLATFLSVGPIPEGLRLVRDDEIVRRVELHSEDDVARLCLVAEEVSLSRWLEPRALLKHLSRRQDKPLLIRATLQPLWSHLTEALSQRGALLGPDATVRAVGGAPGEYFGRHDAPGLEGRWRATPTDGVWCAYRPGFNAAQWHPIILHVQGDERRCIDLYDHDEWRWALLARGVVVGPDERPREEGGSHKATCPLPQQLSSALDLLGPRRSAWAWEIPEDAPDLWALL